MRVLPASFEYGNVVGFSRPGFKVDAGLQPVLFEGLQNDTFSVDLCGGQQAKER